MPVSLQILISFSHLSPVPCDPFHTSWESGINGLLGISGDLHTEPGGGDAAFHLQNIIVQAGLRLPLLSAETSSQEGARLHFTIIS